MTHHDEHEHNQQHSGQGSHEGAQPGSWRAEPVAELEHAEELRAAFAGLAHDSEDTESVGHTAEHVRLHRGAGDHVHTSAHSDAAETSDAHIENGHGPSGQSATSAPIVVSPRAATTQLDAPSVAADARGVLDGVAQNLKTLAGHDGVDGVPVAMFPRGIELLEVRMHISRDRDIDLNFRVAGAAPSVSAN